MKIAILFTLVLGLFYSCASAPNDPEILAESGVKNYSYNKDTCFKAVKSGIKEMGGKVLKRNNKTMKVITNRVLIEKIATATHQEKTLLTNASSTVQQNAIYAKYYVKTSGNKKSCKVSVYDFKIYKNQEQTPKANSGYIAKLLGMFFNSVQTQLDDQV